MIDKTLDMDAPTMAPDGRGGLLAGRYRVVRQLGQGGMGSVWLAENIQLDNRPCAIKMLPSVLVANKRAYAQLKAEALVSLKLVHPNIVALRAFEENNGNPFLVMDYVEGQTLDDYLAEKGCLSEDEAVKILRPIAEALDYAHGEKVVHRDVKPANVMIRQDGHPFILDFGIAREMQETMTRVTGKLSSGTLLYMSPEQLHGASPKPAQDVYSFAAMVYECLSGKPPFARGQIEYQIDHDTPEPPPGAAALVQAVLRGLAKTPEARPKTCLAVLDHAAAPRNNAETRRGRAARPLAAAEAQRRTQSGGAVRGRDSDKALPADEAQSEGSLTAGGRIAWVVAFAALVAAGGYCVWQRHEASERAQAQAWEKYQTDEAKRKAQAKAAQDEAERLREEAAKKRAVTAIKAEASGQAKAIGQIGDGEGFGARKTELAVVLGRADAFYEAGSWCEAAAGYTNYVQGAKALCELDAARAVALAKRDKAAEASKTAKAAEAKKHAAGLWEEACKAWTRGKTALGAMNFAPAGEAFDEAARLFAKCPDEVAREKDRLAQAEAEKKKRQAEQAEKKRQAEAQEMEQNYTHALKYWEGDGVKQDYAQALVYFRKAADKGHAGAQNYIGRAYDEGWGVGKDDAEAVKWYRKAADQGNAVAQNNLGLMYQNGEGVAKDPYQAAQWYRKAADQGHADAQNRLGSMYDNGTGVPLDDAEAVKWYRKAAEQGLAVAQNNLGYAYYFGEGVAKDPYQAVQWFRKAVAQGEVTAMNNLGLAYEHGEGVAKDPYQAIQWYHKAAEQGNAMAQNNLGFAYYRGVGVAKDPYQAVQWYRKAVAQGNVQAQNNLGFAYEHGEGVAKDPYQAVQLYRKAAEQGNAAAMNNLGWAYYRGVGVSKDPYQAVQWYRKAIAQGEAWAMSNLGYAYYNGEGVAKDPYQAVQWYRKAIAQGNASAMNNLAVCYEDGVGVARNLPEAIRLYRQAANLGETHAQAALKRLGY